MSTAPVPVFVDPERTPRLASAFDAIDDAFEEFRRSAMVPGMAWGVVIDDTLVHGGSGGVRDVEAQLPADTGSVFRIASMSKSVTATCVLSLRDEGLLSLDEPAIVYLPQLSGLRYPTSDSPPVTLRSLLTMSSGLVEDDPWADRQLGLDARAFESLLAAGVHFDHPPQTAYEYSNLGYAIVGAVAGAVAGMPLRELATSRVFAPLGMTATTWDVDGLDPRSGRSARGYRAEQGAFVAEDLLPDGAFGPMGGLATSIVDFSKYVAAHLRAWPPRDGPETGPLRRSSMREMAQIWRSFPAAADSGVLAAGYGYGWRVETRARFGTVVAHSGGLPGFGSHVAFLPDHGVGVVAFANRTYAKVRLAVDVALEALADTGGLAPRVSGPSSALELARERVTGLYEHWDDGLAHDSLLGTALLDRDDERRWPDLLALRSRFGACLESGPIAATGALRGSWPMRCALGTFELEVLLGPMPDGRIQFLEVRE